MNSPVVRKKLIIFDKDGCLVQSVIEPKSGKSHAPNRLEDQTYFPDVALRCAQLIAEGNTLAVASNQGGVAFGIFPAEEAEELVKAAAVHINASGYRVCFHHPKGRIAPYNTEHINRKPSPGMLIELMDEFGFQPQDTIMIGDWATDKEAAAAAGCEFIWAHQFFNRTADPFTDRLHAAMEVK